ncbi:hypothetical protein COOONC_12967, partial [Cooperia oncophora]
LQNEECNHISDDPEALVILLYHIDNFTPETKQQLLTASAAQIAAVSQMRPFVGLLPSIFKRVMKIAMNNLAGTGNAFSVARAIILWTAENQHRDLAMSLLKQITIESLSNADAHTLQRLAVESGLECVAALIFSRYHVTFSLDACSMMKRNPQGRLHTLANSMPY